MAEEKQNPEEKGNVFSLIEEQIAPKEASLMDGIIRQKDLSKDTGSVLDTAALKKLSGFTPATSLKEEEYATVAKIVLIITIAVIAALHLFFQTQLAAGFKLFGANVTHKWQDAKENSLVTRNDLIKRSLLLGQMKLEELLDLGQKYEENRDEESKKQIQAAANELRDYLRPEKYSREAIAFYVNEAETDSFYTAHFISQIDAEIADLHQKSQTENNQNEADENKISVQLLESVKRLYQKKAVREEILALDWEKSDFEENLKKITAAINSLSQNNYSLIKQIQSGRLPWETIIKTITAITQKIDPNHAGKRFRDLATIEYSSFSLAGDRLTISGNLKTKDSKNFTQIANLIDLFEKDPLFKDVSAQSFAKSFDPDKGVYLSTLQIQLTLQSGADDRDQKSPFNN